MIALCPVPAPPAVHIIPGGTFVDCNATWLVQADGSVSRVYPLDPAKLRASWRRYCADLHPHNKLAAAICFSINVGR